MQHAFVHWYCLNGLFTFVVHSLGFLGQDVMKFALIGVSVFHMVTALGVHNMADLLPLDLFSACVDFEKYIGIVRHLL